MICFYQRFCSHVAWWLSMLQGFSVIHLVCSISDMMCNLFLDWPVLFSRVSWVCMVMMLKIFRVMLVDRYSMNSHVLISHQPSKNEWQQYHATNYLYKKETIGLYIKPWQDSYSKLGLTHDCHVRHDIMFSSSNYCLCRSCEGVTFVTYVQTKIAT